jgi:hypothetical protein
MSICHTQSINAKSVKKELADAIIICQMQLKFHTRIDKWTVYQRVYDGIRMIILRKNARELYPVYVHHKVLV